MAVTLTAVTPNAGRTGGRVLVELTGTGFQLPVVPPSGPVAPLAPTMRALFGTVPALRVDVVSTTRAFALVPSHDAGAVDVRIDNIDANGNPIGGQNATLAGGYTFKKPDLTAPSTIAHVVRSLIVSLRREILDNVVNVTGVDYDATTADNKNIIEPAALPVIVLVGPRLTEDRFYSRNKPAQDDAGSHEFREKRLPWTAQVEFTVLGGGNTSAEAMALMTEWVLWFNRNRKGLVVPVNTTADGLTPDFSGPTVNYQMEQPFGSAPQMADAANDSDIRQWTATLIIRGVDIDENVPVKAGKAVSDVYPALSSPAQPGDPAPPFDPPPDINQPPADAPVPGGITFEEKV